MSYQIASTSMIVHNVTASANNKKRFFFKADEILPNVATVIYVVHQRPVFGFLKNDFNVNGWWCVPFTQAGTIRIITCLKPQFKTKNTISGNPNFVFNFGMGDGTGEDFTGTMAAELNFTFNPAPMPPPSSTYNGPTVGMNNTPLNGKVAGDYMVRFTDTSFGDVPASHQACTISIAKDGQGKLMIEESVEIHIFDQTNKVLHLMSLEQNETLHINYPTTGFQMLCLVRGNASQSGKVENISFAIGDPKIDAKVTVTEEDV